MVTVAVSSETQPIYDPKKIEKIVDQVFPCAEEAAFIKSVHLRDASKLRPWRHRDDKPGKKFEFCSEAVVFIRRCFLAKSYYYIDCAEKLKRNLETEGFDDQWNIRIQPIQTDAHIAETQPLPNWDDFIIDEDSFPALDDDTFSQYLESSLMGPPEETHFHDSLIDESMDYEVSTEHGNSGYEEASMDTEQDGICDSHLSSTGFKNDYFGLNMECDQDGLPLELLE